MTPETTQTRPSGAAGLSQSAWLDRLAEIGRGHGFFERIGTEHLALFVQEGETLVVSFDRAARTFSEEKSGLPLGFEAVQKREWSLLSIQSLGDSWFRSADLIAFFDKLANSDFFHSFQNVVFVGFGPACGHAACAYSSAAPGSRVLACAPAATLNPEYAGFERRFRRDRKQDFSRYGDAPALTSAATSAVILYDPTDAASGAHAAQFRAAPVTLVPMRFIGPAPQRLIAAGDILMPMLRALCNGRLTRAKVARLIRPVRRADAGYLWRLAGIAQAQGQFDRARLIADYAADITGEGRFADLVETLSPRPTS